MHLHGFVPFVEISCNSEITAGMSVLQEYGALLSAKFAIPFFSNSEKRSIISILKTSGPKIDQYETLYSIFNLALNIH